MNKMKNTIMLMVLLLISVQVNAEELNSSSSTLYEKTTIDEYTKYLNLFREEFKSELLKWEFKRIDEKIKGYEWDIEYISSEKWSQYAGNLDIYKTKLKALKQLREEFISNYKEVKTEFIDYSKEQLLEKEKILKAIEEKRQKEILALKEKTQEFKEKWSEIKEKTSEQVKKLSNIELLKQKKYEIIAKHKENYTKKLWEKLDKLTEEQLQKALDRTNKLIEKYATKESALSQLAALKELIEEKLDANSEINIDEIFEWL